VSSEKRRWGFGERLRKPGEFQENSKTGRDPGMDKKTGRVGNYVIM